LQKEISKTLLRLGIFPNLKGHFAIKQGIIRGLKETASCNNCNENIETKSENANIRSALRTASNSGKLKGINELLGIRVAEEECYFSPAQFLSLLTHYFMYK